MVGAAVLKLALFDLSALDGLARVGAFLGAGLVLLAAGARYAPPGRLAQSGRNCRCPVVGWVTEPDDQGVPTWQQPKLADRAGRRHRLADDGHAEGGGPHHDR